MIKEERGADISPLSNNTTESLKSHATEILSSDIGQKILTETYLLYDFTHRKARQLQFVNTFQEVVKLYSEDYSTNPENFSIENIGPAYFMMEPDVIAYSDNPFGSILEVQGHLEMQYGEQLQEGHMTGISGVLARVKGTDVRFFASGLPAIWYRDETLEKARNQLAKRGIVLLFFAEAERVRHMQEDAKTIPNDPEVEEEVKRLPRYRDWIKPPGLNHASKYSLPKIEDGQKAFGWYLP